MTWCTCSALPNSSALATRGICTFGTPRQVEDFSEWAEPQEPRLPNSSTKCPSGARKKPPQECASAPLQTLVAHAASGRKAHLLGPILMGTSGIYGFRKGVKAGMYMCGDLVRAAGLECCPRLFSRKQEAPKLNTEGAGTL